MYMYAQVSSASLQPALRLGFALPCFIETACRFLSWSPVLQSCNSQPCDLDSANNAEEGDGSGDGFQGFVIFDSSLNSGWIDNSYNFISKEILNNTQ